MRNDDISFLSTAETMRDLADLQDAATESDEPTKSLKKISAMMQQSDWQSAAQDVIYDLAEAVEALQAEGDREHGHAYKTLLDLGRMLDCKQLLSLLRNDACKQVIAACVAEIIGKIDRDSHLAQHKAGAK